MTKKIPPDQVASLEEILLSNVYSQEALINLLEAKGIIKKQDLHDEIKRIKRGSH